MFCDPEAARIVYSSGINLYVVGLNVTMKVKLENDGPFTIVLDSEQL